MSLSSDRKTAIKKLKNLVFLPRMEVKAYRKQMEKVFGNAFLPNNVDFFERDYSNVPCDVLNPEIYSSGRVILYIHGGCFIGGSREAYRPFVSSLAHATLSRAVVPEFRLAPTFAFPLSLEDIKSVFRTLYTEEVVSRSLDGYGEEAETPEIILMGDTSGASLALALALNLEKKYRASIKKIILFSPWLDVSKEAYCFSAKKMSDEILTSEIIKRSCSLYTSDENRSSPFVSPLRASKELLENFPPVYIQLGEDEILLNDAKKFARLLTDSGNSCELDVWNGMMSMFQMADEFLEESHLAIERIGKLIVDRKVTESDSVREIQLNLEHSDFSNRFEFGEN